MKTCELCKGKTNELEKSLMAESGCCIFGKHHFMHSSNKMRKGVSS